MGSPRRRNTAPAGKTASYASFSGALGFGVTAVYTNNSGATRLFSVYAVPAGGSPDNTNILYATSVANGQSSFPQPAIPALRPGDSLVVGTDSVAPTQLFTIGLTEK